MEALREEYCPPLDEALLFALIHDYNLDDVTQLAALKQTLDSLKDDAVQEQDLELLPRVPEIVSNPSIPATMRGDTLQTADMSHNSRSTVRSTTEDDTAASVSTGLTELALSEGTSQGYQQDALGYGVTEEAFGDLPEDQKIQWLSTMFPAISYESVRSSLARNQGKFEQATDELLNLSFMNDEQIGNEIPVPAPAIGIDGFAATSEDRRTKTRGQRKKNQIDNDRVGGRFSDTGDLSDYATLASPATGAKTSASQDIDFIATRTHLKRKTIKSVYHANGSRLPLTIRAFVKQESRKHIEDATSADDLGTWQIDELQHYFPQIPRSLIYGTFMLTDNTASATKELLEVLLTDKEEPIILGKLDGVVSYTPLDLADNESRPRKEQLAGNQTHPLAEGNHTLTHMTNSHGVAASRAFDQASAAWKKAKSDRLMGGAAAYYASIGQEHIKAAKTIQAVEADVHVARQSTSTSLDLHGVNVANAVRITREGTEAWWEELGDRKYVSVGGVGNGYKIITGVGRHSSDGVGRIGPAISKMLVREGWKVEVGSGEVIVWGRARKH